MPGSSSDDKPTIAAMVRARADDDGPALLWDDEALSYRDYVRGCAARAAWMGDNTAPSRSTVRVSPGFTGHRRGIGRGDSFHSPR